MSSAITDWTPSPTELDQLYREIPKSEKPVLLSIIPGYCDNFVPLCEQGLLPKPLTDLYREEYLHLSYIDLLTKCEAHFTEIKITVEQVKNVEEKTREQAASRLWFQQRAGRITASKLKAAVHTDSTQPSQSLIKAICYPESQQFKTRATVWGCKHEITAKEAYKTQCEQQHTDFSISASDLVINPSYPYMAATPDGNMRCKCCGHGVLEIKCPFSCKDKSFIEASAESRFYLKHTNGKFTLNTTHAYYYQIQAQIRFCGAKYGDFVVWRQNELVVQRIYLDETFIGSIIKATEFLKLGILPELLGKWYTKPPTTCMLPDCNHSSTPTSDANNPTLWCLCRKEEFGEMIPCDNELCKILWFHTSCLKLTCIPKGKWICPECRKATKKKK